MGCTQSAPVINPVLIEKFSPALLKHSVVFDLKAILETAKLPEGFIEVGKFLSVAEKFPNTASVYVKSNVIFIDVSASVNELVSTFYFAIQRLGFLFPHPRMQIQPDSSEKILSAAKSLQGKTLIWKPRFTHRGFHLHTEIANEWTRGFLQGDSAIANDTVTWLARNQQNVFEIVLLSTVSKADTAKFLTGPFQLANHLAIHCGISLGTQFHQHKSAHLAMQRTLSGKFMPAYDLERKLKETQAGIKVYIEGRIPFDFMSLDIGVSDSNPNPKFDDELALIDVAYKCLEPSKRDLFLKVRSAAGPTDPKYGDLPFSLLPSLADPHIGVMSHTKMIYGLADAIAPIHGGSDYKALKDFMQQEASKRPCWYYPETSYWNACDIDIPLLLTDLLLSRQSDMKLATAAGVKGHITSTSGHGMGYWLFDWTTALLCNEEHASDPYIGLKLLGEKVDVWKKEAEFQRKFFKEQGCLAYVTSAHPTDEVPTKHRSGVLTRNTLSDLRDDPELLIDEIQLLEQAVAAAPTTAPSVVTPELSQLVDVTHIRINHALTVRKALLALTNKDESEKEARLVECEEMRKKALALVSTVVSTTDSRYPDSGIHTKELKNPTDYAFGYLWPAAVLHFWEREERMIRFGIFHEPGFMNIYTPPSHLF